MALALLLFPRGIPRQVAKSDHIQPFGGPFVSWRWPWWYPSPLRLVLFYENGIGYCKDDDESIIHYLHGRIFQPGVPHLSNQLFTAAAVLVLVVPVSPVVVLVVGGGAVEDDDTVLLVGVSLS
jgi:hypothetical protein